MAVAKHFHSYCDRVGMTITIVRFRQFIFGGFLDTNWGGMSTLRLVNTASLPPLAHCDFVCQGWNDDCNPFMASFKLVTPGTK